jgi:hypothetical protein
LQNQKIKKLAICTFDEYPVDGAHTSAHHDCSGRGQAQGTGARYSQHYTPPTQQLPVHTMTAVGVARPRAQGHAIASTAHHQHNNYQCTP